ncbi:MAG: hypothetical protein AAFX06_12975 [Planctomycetota bacterium]
MNGRANCLGWITLCVALSFTGCSGNEEPPHEHAAPAHMPRNMADLSDKIRRRLERVEAREDATAVAELSDLIGWTAEIAADTEIGEGRWNPIYELSETLRLAINQSPKDWSSGRRDQAVELCQLVEDAWESLAPQDRVDRYLGHDHGHGGHDHGHSHGHGDHKHGDHGHGHSHHGHSHAHGDHNHRHGEDGHGHRHGEHGDHSHGDHEHGDHEHGDHEHGDHEHTHGDSRDSDG